MSLLIDLELATRLARHAAVAILDVRAEARRRPQTKSDASPVTDADLAADVVIRGGLPADDVVVTEESWSDAPLPASGRVWFVDPIDGTEDFVQGSADYVVQIGLVIDGAPRLGVVLQPATGTVWRGIVDGPGSFCDRSSADGTTTRLVLPVGAFPRRPPRIAASVSHPSTFVDFVVPALGGVVVPCGSVGLKAALICEGRADAYVTASRRIKVWDTAAPAALVLAAGGDASSLGQQPLVYGGPVGHEDGVCLWSRPARDALRAPLAAAVARFAAPPAT